MSTGQWLVCAGVVCLIAALIGGVFGGHAVKKLYQKTIHRIKNDYQ